LSIDDTYLNIFIFTS